MPGARRTPVSNPEPAQLAPQRTQRSNRGQNGAAAQLAKVGNAVSHKPHQKKQVVVPPRSDAQGSRVITPALNPMAPEAQRPPPRARQVTKPRKKVLAAHPSVQDTAPVLPAEQHPPVLNSLQLPPGVGDPRFGFSETHSGGYVGRYGQRTAALEPHAHGSLLDFAAPLPENPPYLPSTYNSPVSTPPAPHRSSPLIAPPTPNPYGPPPPAFRFPVTTASAPFSSNTGVISQALPKASSAAAGLNGGDSDGRDVQEDDDEPEDDDGPDDDGPDDDGPDDDGPDDDGPDGDGQVPNTEEFSDSDTEVQYNEGPNSCADVAAQPDRPSVSTALTHPVPLDDQAGTVFQQARAVQSSSQDVLDEYWRKNRRPKPPAAPALHASAVAIHANLPAQQSALSTPSHNTQQRRRASVGSDDDDDDSPQPKKRRRRSKKADDGDSDNGQSTSLTIIRLTPPWRWVVRQAKSSIQLARLTQNAFIDFDTGMKDAAEAVYEACARHQDEFYGPALVSEPGMPSIDIFRLVYEEGSTYRGAFKRVAQGIVHSMCIPKGDQNSATSYKTQVQDAVGKLLRDGAYLHGLDTSEQHVNFGSHVLREIALRHTFAPGHPGALFPATFQNGLPPAMIAFAGVTYRCCLEEWKTGARRNVSMTAKDFQKRYLKIFEDIKDVLNDPKHGPVFKAMLVRWAEMGRSQMAPKYDNDNDSDMDNGIVLS
ncbi:hypothetical protein FA95DRAFT_1612842 [Auriscalpium vulgare]|uniref:Uncharacterized protein n=1 Tax=Auriscalpium vulgare TaxID=40419 RepID=A0ACB8R4R1_9AGAM|nr:hypothetical protein FA95DRAFT_1612842 [Auriscalpium vulgare]